MKALDLLEQSLYELLELETNERDLEILDEMGELLQHYKNVFEEKRSKVFFDLIDLEDTLEEMNTFYNSRENTDTKAT